MLQHKDWNKLAFDDVLYVNPPRRSQATAYLGTKLILTHGCTVDETDFEDDKYCEEFDNISQMVGN